MSRLTIRRAAPAMQFQDLGRYGHTHMGLSQGGPIDLHAHCWANHLLENDSNATTIEISYGNCALRAEVDCLIALTGAEMSARIEGESVQNWSSHFLEKGQTLQLNYASSGIHAYLAIQQGFQAPKTLASSATVVRNKIGELLKSETSIGYSYSAKHPESQKRTPLQYIPDYASTTSVRAILPPNLSTQMKDLLVNTRFTISQHSDRMGMNLTADQPLPTLPGIISEGTSIGTIQLPPNGHPIVLLNDRQTQGGYAKIGTIARVDIPLLAQSRPGSNIYIDPVELSQASSEWLDFAEFFQIGRSSEIKADC